MDRYQICVALDERFGPNEVSDDVCTDQQHPLQEHEVQIATNPQGRAVLILTFTAVDLWTAVLTGMALVRQSGYVPTAIQASATTGRYRVRNGWRKRRSSTTSAHFRSASISATAMDRGSLGGGILDLVPDRRATAASPRLPNA